MCIRDSTYTIDGWITKWEQEINRKLFKPSEKKKLFVKYNLNGLLKADAKSRGEFYKALSGIGAITPNQIAKLEDMNPVDGGDRSFKQMQDIPLDRMDEYLDSLIQGKDIKQSSNGEE
jgi:phage portal protein BeeE